MPRKRLTMRKIREVLRLKAAGLNIREVAEGTGSARTTVYEYLVRAEGAGLSWPLPEDLDDEALEARLFPPATAELARRRPVPDWREVHRELRSGKHVTLRLLWLEWKQAHPDGWGYSQFCAHYERWLGAQDVVMRLSYPAGERMFVDFSGDKVPLHRPRAPGRWPRPRSSWPCSAARGCSTWRPRRTRGYRAGSWPTCTPSRPMAAPRWRPRPIICARA